MFADGDCIGATASPAPTDDSPYPQGSVMSVRQLPIIAPESSAASPLSPYAEFGLRVAERFGVPTVLLIAVGWWVQSGVVQPLLNAHFDVVGKIVNGQQKHTDKLDSIGDKIDELIRVSRDAAQTSKTK